MVLFQRAQRSVEELLEKYYVAPLLLHDKSGTQCPFKRLKRTIYKASQSSHAVTWIPAQKKPLSDIALLFYASYRNKNYSYSIVNICNTQRVIICNSDIQEY